MFSMKIYWLQFWCTETSATASDRSSCSTKLIKTALRKIYLTSICKLSGKLQLNITFYCHDIIEIKLLQKQNTLSLTLKYLENGLFSDSLDQIPPSFLRMPASGDLQRPGSKLQTRTQSSADEHVSCLEFSSPKYIMIFRIESSFTWAWNVKQANESI